MERFDLHRIFTYAKDSLSGLVDKEMRINAESW